MWWNYIKARRDRREKKHQTISKRRRNPIFGNSKTIKAKKSGVDPTHKSTLLY
jgi:hypothetical protein